MKALTILIVYASLWGGCGAEEKANPAKMDQILARDGKAGNGNTATPKDGDLSKKPLSSNSNTQANKLDPLPTQPSLPPLGPSKLDWNAEEFVGSSTLALLPLE